MTWAAAKVAQSDAKLFTALARVAERRLSESHGFSLFYDGKAKPARETSPCPLYLKSKNKPKQENALELLVSGNNNAWVNQDYVSKGFYRDITYQWYGDYPSQVALPSTKSNTFNGKFALIFPCLIHQFSNI